MREILLISIVAVLFCLVVVGQGLIVPEQVFTHAPMLEHFDCGLKRL
jgi:hypothetical protein